MSLDEQIGLLLARGLTINDPPKCRATLQRVGYYHLSGYGRFFQVDPGLGDNRYRPGTTFEACAELQELDSRLRQVCLGALGSVELAIRTGFGYRFAQLIDPYTALLDPASFLQVGSGSNAVHDLIAEDLYRSKQPFITRHRTPDGTYQSLPAWIAVEALSFGTLSKAIERCATSSVASTMADDLNLPRQGFSSQIRSFVALRNAAAHMSRLWNDVAKNPPHVQRNITGRVKKRVGSFHPHSYYQAFVALDRFASVVDSNIRFLEQVDQLIGANDTYRLGLLNPRPYK